MNIQIGFLVRSSNFSDDNLRTMVGETRNADHNLQEVTIEKNGQPEKGQNWQ